MHTSALGGRINTLEWALEHGLDVCVRDNEVLRYMLHYVDIYRLLMPAIMVLYPTKHQTPAHCGARAGHIDTLQWLCGHGADFNAQDKHVNYRI